MAISEWQKVNDCWYYFTENGEMVTGIWAIDGKVYQFNESGKMTATLASTVKDGWLKVGNSYAYIRKGVLVRGNQIIDGNKYAFDYNGLMLKNSFYYGYHEFFGYGSMYYGADGKLAEYVGWQKINGYWYYFTNEHICYEAGLTTIDGKTYHLNGSLATGWVMYNGHLLQFDSSGVLVGEDTTQNGWVQRDGFWYYFKNGEIATGIQTINGTTYGFYYGGRLANQEVVDMYFFNEKGVLSASKGWKQSQYGYRYYTDANGKVYTGIHVIDGTTYYFNEGGELLP